MSEHGLGRTLANDECVCEVLVCPHPFRIRERLREVADHQGHEGFVDGVIDLTQIPPSTLVTMDRDFRAGLTQQFNVLVEKQFGNNVIIGGFVGMRGSRIAMNIPDINRALPTGNSTSSPKPFAVLPQLGTLPTTFAPWPLCALYNRFSPDDF